jgi:hypothetical protein
MYFGSEKPAMDGVLTDGVDRRFLHFEKGIMYLTGRITTQDEKSQELVLGTQSLRFD